MSLDNFIKKVNVELGCHIQANPQYSDFKNLLPPLQKFYSESNGLIFPFITINPAEKIDSKFVSGWLLFGSDHYFSYCLCKNNGIDLWDHDSGSEPEVAYNDVIELLEASYIENIEESDLESELYIKYIPSNLNNSHVIKKIKKISNKSSSELLSLLKECPVAFPCIMKEGIIIVRELQSDGVKCNLKFAT